MNEGQQNNELVEWVSTYSLVTIERVLERYKMRFTPTDLTLIIKNPTNVYHRLIRLPLKNVHNGIILQQVKEYQIYAQKLFIDYLLSGETAKPETSPGGITRDDLEKERQVLINMGEAFQETELAHNHLIAESQLSLMKLADKWRKNLNLSAKRIKKFLKKKEALLIEGLTALLIEYNFAEKDKFSFKNSTWQRIEKIIAHELKAEQKQIFVNELLKLSEFVVDADKILNPFGEKITAMKSKLRDFREQLYNLILKIQELIQLLPEYKADPSKIEQNREALHFDRAIGEEKD